MFSPNLNSKINSTICLFIAILCLTTNAMYEDDGYFDPRWVKPHHFNTEEEILEQDFYDRLLEAEQDRIEQRR